MNQRSIDIARRIHAYMMKSGRDRRAAAGHFGISYAHACWLLRGAGLRVAVAKSGSKANGKKRAARKGPMGPRPKQAPDGQPGRICSCCKTKPVKKGNRFLCDLCFRGHRGYVANSARV